MNVMALCAALLLVCVGATAGGERGLCREHPKSQWMAERELRIVLLALGYHIHHLRVSQGCYVMDGLTRDGVLHRLYLDPVSGEAMASITIPESESPQGDVGCGSC